jgi:hypothetical protein
VVLLLIGFATSAAGQGTSGPVIGGESQGITQIRGKVLCGDCNLTDVREDQSNVHKLYQLTYPGGRLVFQVEWVSEPQRWTDLVSSPLLHVHRKTSLFQQLVAEENLFREVEITGLLRDTQTLDISEVSFRGKRTSMRHLGEE